MNSTIFKTSLPVYRYEFKWILENFSGLSAIPIQTPYFSPIPDQEWFIEIQKGTNLCAFLCGVSTFVVKIAYESTLYDNTEHVYHSEQNHQSDNKLNVRMDILKKFTGLNQLINLPNDVLILKCILKFYKIQTPKVEMIDLKFEDSNNAAEQTLLNLESILEKSEHCDVTVKVDGISIKTHKAILCANSPIFTKMFNHNVKESISNIIDITDISGPIMRKFIALLYCPILKEKLDLNTACDLYYVSDKYEVLTLRNMIGKEILNLLNNENALEILSIVDGHNDNRLKEKIVKYVRFNFRTIVNLDCWTKFVVDNSRLAATLVTNYFKDIAI